MKTLIGFVVALLVVFSTMAPADQAPIFHGIKLGVSLGSQFQECPWNPPKEGDIPEYISSPYKDEKGNTVPCFHYFSRFTKATYPQAVEGVELIDQVRFLKDAQGHVLPHELTFLNSPTIHIRVLVPASALLSDGTIEEVTLAYLPVESDRVRDALTKKFGASHPSEKKIGPKMMDYFGQKLISNEVWEPGWGELSLVVTDKFVTVRAQTSKLSHFEQENKKDEF
jgi:hypothetical protein